MTDAGKTRVNFAACKAAIEARRVSSNQPAHASNAPITEETPKRSPSVTQDDSQTIEEPGYGHGV
jgi:hypothetical protein